MHVSVTQLRWGAPRHRVYSEFSGSPQLAREVLRLQRLRRLHNYRLPLLHLLHLSTAASPPP